MDDFLGYVKLIGGVLGIIAFFWKVIDSIKSYLQISIKVEKDKDNELSILSSINNKSTFSKDIKNAFVLISPEKEDVVNAVEKIRKATASQYPNLNIVQFKWSNDFVTLKLDESIYVSGKYGYIPLKFFYSENATIGDEELSYRASIDKTKLENGVYSARLFVFHKTRLHRTTQDLFRITKD